MKILLFGKSGQVGWELQRSLAPLGELIALDIDSTAYCGDLTDLEGVAMTIRDLGPDVIVNAAAYTAVDKAESEPELAQRINAEAVEVLAKEALKLDAWLIHYSTDYVFSGSGDRPWQETDATGPLSVYGASKLAGDRAIEASGCKYLIFRTSWVYAARGNNFAKTILRLAQERDSLNVIDDQCGTPTSAELIADVSAHALRSVLRQPELGGLYNMTASGETNWHQFAQLVLKQAATAGMSLKATADQVGAIESSGYPTAAERPLNSRLNTTKLENAFELRLPHWESCVERMLTEFLEKEIR